MWFPVNNWRKHLFTHARLNRYFTAQSLSPLSQSKASKATVLSDGHCLMLMNNLRQVNPFRTKTPKIVIPKRKWTSIASSNWQQKFLYFHYKSVKLDVLGRQNNEHLAILFNLKSCQFAPTCRIVIFNLCICCQFEDLQIISPKIIQDYEPSQHLTVTNEGSFFCRNIFSLFWYTIQNF